MSELRDQQLVDEYIKHAEEKITEFTMFRYTETEF